MDIFGYYISSSLIVNFLLSNIFLENVSLITGLLYLTFLIKQKRIAWIFGFISSIIFTYLYFLEEIYMQTILNFYYAAMAIYGFIQWSKKDDRNKRLLKISEYSVKTHLILIFVTILLSGTVATFLTAVLHSAYSTLDSIIFAFSILATYLQTHKIVSNWIYWCFINSLSIILLLYLSLYSLTLLSIIYTIIAIWGYKKWKMALITQKK